MLLALGRPACLCARGRLGASVVRAQHAEGSTRWGNGVGVAGPAVSTGACSTGRGAHKDKPPPVAARKPAEQQVREGAQAVCTIGTQSMGVAKGVPVTDEVQVPVTDEVRFASGKVSVQNRCHWCSTSTGAWSLLFPAHLTLPPPASPHPPPDQLCTYMHASAPLPCMHRQHTTHVCTHTHTVPHSHTHTPPHRHTLTHKTIIIVWSSPVAADMKLPPALAHKEDASEGTQAPASSSPSPPSRSAPPVRRSTRTPPTSTAFSATRCTDTPQSCDSPASAAEPSPPLPLPAPPPLPACRLPGGSGMAAAGRKCDQKPGSAPRGSAAAWGMAVVVGRGGTQPRARPHPLHPAPPDCAPPLPLLLLLLLLLPLTVLWPSRPA